MGCAATVISPETEIREQAFIEAYGTHQATRNVGRYPRGSAPRAPAVPAE